MCPVLNCTSHNIQSSVHSPSQCIKNNFQTSTRCKEKPRRFWVYPSPKPITGIGYDISFNLQDSNFECNFIHSGSKHIKKVWTGFQYQMKFNSPWIFDVCRSSSSEEGQDFLTFCWPLLIFVNKVILGCWPL